MRAIPLPRVWTLEELEEARLLDIADFVSGRTEQGDESYAAILATATAEVERLFVATNDLTALGDGEILTDDARYLAALRYTSGPPISADDLVVMANAAKRTRRFLSAEAQRIASLLWLARDKARFPWLDPTPARRPDDIERRVAISVTASLMATQRIATVRRNESSDRQEGAVKTYLRDAAFELVPARAIDAPDDIERGQFCGEARVAGDKADLTVRLRDGRLLLIECKVSGSALNSVKRLNDIGNKAATWRRAFGDIAIPMGVIAGVFRLVNLANAQNRKAIALVWERDLAPLGDFLLRAV